MPRTNVPVTDVTRAGVDPAEVNGDTANNHEFLAQGGAGHVVLVARNNGATPRNVTLQIATKVDGQQPPGKVVQIPATGKRYIGPFPPDYVQADGKVYVDVDHADLRLVALRTP